MIERNTQLMKLNQIPTKMCIQVISLRCDNFVYFVFCHFENWFFSCNHYNCTARLGHSNSLLCFEKSEGGLKYHILLWPLSGGELSLLGGLPFSCISCK